VVEVATRCDCSLLQILRSLLLSDLVPDGDIFGELLRKWVYGGFEWPVRKRAMGIGQTVMSVILAAESGKGYREAADSVWHASRRSLAANGAVMRTSVVAVPFFRDVEVAVDTATTFAGATHSDPRSVVSCIAVVVALANMLQCAADGTEPNFETIHGLALQRCNRYMEQFALSTTAPASASVMTSFSYAAAMEELQQVFAETTLEALRLDAHGSIGYTFKCLGSGLVCWRKVAVDGCSFVDAVCDLSAEAGDADTNAAVAGALMGCWLGYEKLMEQVAPLGWQDMHLRDELLVPLMDMLVGKLDEHKIL
jgi:ADP-ribosylglycohydrolase